jgi:glycosyltransferase involved in cell wall biosynthesis
MDTGVLRRMLKICKHYNVKIWHGHDYKSNLLGIMLRPFWSMKLVTTLHGWVKHTSRTPLYYAVDRWCLPYYHHVIAVSDDLLAEAAKLGLPEDRLTLIQNGVDEKTFHRKMKPADSPLRKEMGTPPGRLVIGGVGRLSPEKAFGTLIKAVAAQIEQGRDVELWIIGEGDHQSDLEALIEHLELQGRVKLLGFRADTTEIYQAMDLFVLSSLREGLPNVVLEAMATQVAVVSTRVAGVPRLIEDGISGLLVPVGELEPLIEAMGRVLSDAVLREQLATAGRTTIERSFSFSQRMAREKAVYDRVMERPSGLAEAEPALPSRQPQSAAVDEKASEVNHRFVRGGNASAV